MNADGAIHFAAAPKQASKREVSLDGLVVDPNHVQEMLESLVSLLIEQEVEPLEVVDIQRRRCVFFVAFSESSHGPAGCSQQQIYEAIQDNRRQDCELLPPPQDEECLADYQQSYEDYREALDEAKAEQ